MGALRYLTNTDTGEDLMELLKKKKDKKAKKAKKEHMGDFSAEDLLFVVQAHMDFEEEQNQD